ncbi:NAD(P)/FAD-dependent oxidoreductase [Oceanimonas doudoroffii]|uniref:FAD-dependent oxidoreductase n=1 Tax=Oceanimonas doudoroffii TaxID=84158 RepID=A0A233RIG2_9GAMM|nr:FAD-dependent oxidoreductase [Oceanimonas doudoroffii]OXY83185.1 FAD-dependent oxidoreductase [Oceanimonas doudoroffii]
MSNYNDTSFWFNTMDHKPTVRPSLPGNIDADVAIIGAGYTGLWTAYYLKEQDPALNVVVLEADIAGYGASGRNGGWVAGYIAGLDKYVAPLPMEKRRECCRILFENVDNIGSRLEAEGIDAHFHKGGVLYAAARYPEQEAMQRKMLAQLYEAGHTEEDCRWLNARELAEKVRLRNGLGAVYKSHCATVNPARMARGLAAAVEKKGVRIYEKTRVTSFRSGEVTTEHGVVRAPVVVPALEGYSSSVGGFGRYIIPVQSLIVATEPLSESLWKEIGLEGREAFCDGSRMVSYGQKSADGRMIFGARGGYVYGGKPRSHFSLANDEFRVREELMYDLFPMLRGVKITHGWGGSLGMPRNFAPHAIFDLEAGIATAGGYGGQGVGPSHLFGRTLADMILGRETELTRMPWVFNNASHHQALRKWEPEPFRWLTSKTIVKAFTWEENLYLKIKGSAFSKSVANNVSNALSRLMR